MSYGVEVTATVQYWCILSDEDSEKVDKYISDHAEEDPTLEEAIGVLYGNGEISLYDDSTESDFLTRSIDNAEPLS